jgi:hypothetical protein
MKRRGGLGQQRALIVYKYPGPTCGRPHSSAASRGVRTPPPCSEKGGYLPLVGPMEVVELKGGEMGQRRALTVYKYSELLAVGLILLRPLVVRGSPLLGEGISAAQWAEKKGWRGYCRV